MTAAPSGPPRSAPVLLTSLTSAALGDGLGDLRYRQECRGGESEWGGVYGQLIRLTGPWSLELELGSENTNLPLTCVDAGSTPGGWRSHHQWNDIDLVQQVVANPRPSGAVRRLSLRTATHPDGPLTITSRFSPYLFPVLVEGIRPPGFDVRTAADELSVRHRGFGLCASASLAPSHLLLNRASWLGGRYRGPVAEIAIEYEVELDPARPTDVSFQIAGGIERDLRGALAQTGTPPPSAAEVATQSARELSEWTDRTPELRFPDAPELEEGYRTARVALRRLYTAPADRLVGLVAGYPWYSSIWCRDLAVMLPAVLWLGDFEWAARSLTSVFHFQSRQRVALLAGEVGELPMQLAPGPIFLYGTSDSTLRFPGVVAQLHRHTGDHSAVAAWADAVHRIVEWGRARSDPQSGLLRHGGEVEQIAAATAGLSRVRYGIDSPDTTIWDSADRRDHAIDVQVLWRETLEATALLLGHAADPKRQATCENLRDRVSASLSARYPWAEESYFYDSLRGGQPVLQLRPNALRAVSAGVIEASRARAAVARAARDDLTTPWGVRTLSSQDPAYDPSAYHQGQVWTIATAWAADAAFAVGDVELGVTYLRTIAASYDASAGLAPECYRGDRPEPYNSCYVLGFSLAPFVTLLFERLWGLRLGDRAEVVQVRPGFPSTWRAASLRRLRVGTGSLDLEWTPGTLRARWSGPLPLRLDLGYGPVELAPGEERLLETAATGERS